MGKTPRNQRPEKPVQWVDDEGNRWVEWPSVGVPCRVFGPKDFERERGESWDEFCERQTSNQ